MYKFVIDMMGSDNGPKGLIKAIDEFSKIHQDIFFYLVGKVDEFDVFKDRENFKLIQADDVISMDDNPVASLKRNESSMIKAIKTYKEEKADCIISAGSTGAYLTAATFLVGRIKGIKRPGLVTPFPTMIKNKSVVLLDIGANNLNTVEELVQFAFMGRVYTKYVLGIENPKSYLLSNGTEDHKGTNLIQDTNKKLREIKFENFIGNIEGRHVLDGEADLVITDGFSGNLFLKTCEGVFGIVSKLLKQGFKKNLKTKMGYLLSHSVIDNIKETFNYKKVGAAMLLGIDGYVIKAHGNSDFEGFTGALNVSLSSVKNQINTKIKEELNISDESR